MRPDSGVTMRCILISTACLYVASSAVAEPQPGGRLSSSRPDSEVIRGSAPVLGFAAGSSASELTVMGGIAGAANADGKIRLPESVSRSYVAPGGSYVLVEQPDGIGVLLLSELFVQGTAEPVVTTIAGIGAGADAVVFSASGSAAAVVANNTVRVIAGLPNQPHLLARASSLPGEDSHILAVSDDGATIAIWSSSGVDVLSGSGRQRIHATAEAPSAVFARASHDLLLGDRTNGSLIIFRESSAYSPVTIAQFERPTRPDALAATEDGGFVLAVSSTDLRLAWVEASTGQTGSIELPAKPDRLNAVSARDVFLISATAGEPMWAIAWRSRSPQVFFVPRTLAAGNQ